jgi:integrase
MTLTRVNSEKQRVIKRVRVRASGAEPLSTLNHNQMAQPSGSNVPPWNKGRNVGQKRALSPQEVRLIRDRLRAEGRVRDLALFNLALDSKLPASDLVCLQVSDVWYPHRVRQRGRVVLQRSGKPLQFEITTETKAAITEWLSLLGSPMRQKYLFPSRVHSKSHLSGRQYSRLVFDWVEGAGLDPDLYGTQSLRRTKVLLIVQTTGNLKAAQLLLGHTKIESTARYLETELNAALKISEKVEL